MLLFTAQTKITYLHCLFNPAVCKQKGIGFNIALIFLTLHIAEHFNK